MQQVEYSKEHCVMFDERGTCYDCQDQHHCTIRAAIAEQAADVYGRLIVAAVIGAFLVGLWIS